MAKMQITRGHTDDWPSLFSLDGNSSSDYSYKVEISRASDGYGIELTRFRLPRTVGLTYPKDKARLLSQLSSSDIVLIGKIQNEAIAFACLDAKVHPDTVQITDLVVMENARLKGIGSILMAAAEKWALERKLHRLFLAIPLRNDAMVSLARKLGYSFCGFMAMYFQTGEDALFYEKRIG
jgi:ribosomal protein S18 acetylase RimI-like enzyme